MRQDTFNTLVRMVADDPLTDAQIRQLTNEDMYKLVSNAEAARILGISVQILRTLPISRVWTNKRNVQYRLHDLYKYINEHTEVI